MYFIFFMELHSYTYTKSKLGRLIQGNADVLHRLQIQMKYDLMKTTDLDQFRDQKWDSYRFQFNYLL